MAENNDAGDPLSTHRAAVAKAMGVVQSYQGNPGTPEMVGAHNALFHLGIAYQHLDVPAKREPPPSMGRVPPPGIP